MITRRKTLANKSNCGVSIERCESCSSNYLRIYYYVICYNLEVTAYSQNFTNSQRLSSNEQTGKVISICSSLHFGGRTGLDNSDIVHCISTCQTSKLQPNKVYCMRFFYVRFHVQIFFINRSISVTTSKATNGNWWLTRLNGTSAITRVVPSRFRT